MGNWFAEKLGPPPTHVVQRFEPGQPWPPVVPPNNYNPAQPTVLWQPVPTVQPQVQQAPPNLSGAVINSVGDLLAAAPYWQGSREEKANTAQCPKCGGPLQMYTGLNAPKVMNRDGVSCRPMERCHYCGFNGHFEQIGQQATDSGVAIRVL